MKEYEENRMKIMRLEEVKACTGLGRSSIYKLMSEGHFPKAVSLLNRSVGWVSHEIDSWILARIEERDEKVLG